MRLLVALVGSLLLVGAARAEDGRAPLTSWLEGVAESAQALSVGDDARAEIAARNALASRPGEARAELALGLSLGDGGRFAEAAAVLGRVLPRLEDPELTEVARFEHAQALFYLGHPGAAAVLFAQVGSRQEGSIARRARWREADALLESGAPRLAARAYQALLLDEPASGAAPGARLALAAALRASGDDAGAISTYRVLWIDRPADPAGRAAGRALRAWRQSGGAVPLPSADERLARASRLLELALPRRALKALDRLETTKPPSETAARSSLLRALALLQLGRHTEAASLAQALRSSPAATTSVLAGAELVLARAAARAGRLEEAARRYRNLSVSKAEIAGLSPAQSRALAEDAAFLAAWLYYDAGAYARAAQLLRAYARAHPRAHRAEDARWFEAWSLYRLGKREEARRALSRLAHGALEPAALYWQARLAGGREAQRTLYRRVLRQAPPGSWYALLAAGRLGAMGEHAPTLGAAPSVVLPDDSAAHGADALARAARLLGTGLTAEALAELRVAAASREAHSAAALLAQLAEIAGDAELPFRMARDHLAPTRRAQRWLYPRPFRELMAGGVEATVDPYLYLAVMRRESAFRPDARSGAGAVGLVQLIPPTAERVAVVHGVAPGSVRELELPEVSLPLGAAYLGLLTERFAVPAVVLAAYNAGPPSAAKWARDRAGMPLDEWAEDIPFRETRRYVKNVNADYVLYRALWEGGPLMLDGSLPVPAPREGVGF